MERVEIWLTQFRPETMFTNEVGRNARAGFQEIKELAHKENFKPESFVDLVRWMNEHFDSETGLSSSTTRADLPSFHYFAREWNWFAYDLKQSGFLHLRDRFGLIASYMYVA
jgi:hypothetical protein